MLMGLAFPNNNANTTTYPNNGSQITTLGGATDPIGGTDPGGSEGDTGGDTGQTPPR